MIAVPATLIYGLKSEHRFFPIKPPVGNWVPP